MGKDRSGAGTTPAESSGPIIQREDRTGPSYEPASQAQILRAHQRDTSQIRRLTDLLSEILRSIAGTRWLAHKQTAVDLCIRAAYLILTLGRGQQTLGEEYTDIKPYAFSQRRIPSRRRRLLTILLLLFPSILTSQSFLNYLRQDTNTNWRSGRWRVKLAGFLESPFGQSLPEIHVIAFLITGRFFEVGRRITGLGYASTLPPKPPEQRHASYEPLAILLTLPILYRLFPRRIATAVTSPATNGTTSANQSQRLLDAMPPLSPPLTPPLSAEESLLSTKAVNYDQPNSYLTDAAKDLPERQCTLCLEPRGTGEGSGGTVAVTECGHVFCWGCLGGVEKLECPLCRQTIRMERLIAAYNL